MPRTILLARPQALIVARRKPYPEQGGHSQRPCGAHSPGGVLHDLGKVGLPDATLRKTDRLTKEDAPSSRPTPPWVRACWRAASWRRMTGSAGS